MSKVEYIVLSSAICTVWILLSLPVIFYHIPVTTSNGLNRDVTRRRNLTNTSSFQSPLEGECSSPVIYTGKVCHDVLKYFRNCLPDTQTNKDILVPFLTYEVEQDVMEKIEIIKSLAFSEECSNLAVPLVCLYYFGPLCDSRGVAYKPSISQCLELSAGLCKREWILVHQFSPDCYGASFVDKTVLSGTCDASHSKDYIQQTRVNSSGNYSVQCSKDFFCMPGTDSCTPSCSWKEHSEINNTMLEISLVLSSTLGLIFGIVLLVSSCFRRKKMCSFPTVIIIYQTISAMIMATVILVGFINRTGLFCRSINLLDSIRNATPFCVITGMVLQYLLSFTSLWWLCHVSTLFWIVMFLFKGRNFRVGNRIKYIHTACAILCFSLSFLPIAVISLDDLRKKSQGLLTLGTAGFGISVFPPIVCTATNRSTFYYSFVLPVNLILAIGVAQLIIMIWLFYKQHNNPVKDETETPSLKIGATEKKTFVLLCYYLTVSVLGLTVVTIVSRNGAEYSRELFHYFACKSASHNFNHACSKSGFERFHNTGLAIISFVLIGMIPLVNCIFVINYSEVIRILKRCSRHSAAGKENGLLIPKDPSPNEQKED